MFVLMVALSVAAVLASGCTLAGEGETTTSISSQSTETTIAEGGVEITMPDTVASEAETGGDDTTGDEVELLLEELTDENAAADSLDGVPELE
jgi:ABC-type oligopeptide transport system substrate-binding subunit